MDIDQQIEILQAYKDGKRLERRYLEGASNCRRWLCYESATPIFNFATYEYRIVRSGRDRLIDEYTDIMRSLERRDQYREYHDLCALSGIIERLIEGKYGELRD